MPDDVVITDDEEKFIGRPADDIGIIVGTKTLIIRTYDMLSSSNVLMSYLMSA